MLSNDGKLTWEAVEQIEAVQSEEDEMETFHPDVLDTIPEETESVETILEELAS